jgi:hypothetical protein
MRDEEKVLSDIRRMGAYVDKYFGPVGGFSAYQNTIEFVTVLPNSDMVEVDGILEKLTKNFQVQGILHIQAGANKSTALKEYVEFTIRTLAKQNQKEIDLNDYTLMDGLSSDLVTQLRNTSAISLS